MDIRYTMTEGTPVYTDYQAQSDGYRRDADKFYRRARRDARRAGDFYKSAASRARHAKWLTARPDLWEADGETGFTPAAWEADAASWERLGDTYLRSSFWNTKQARFYRELMATYAGMAARAAARAEAAR
jgi:hypothetical protein